MNINKKAKEICKRFGAAFIAAIVTGTVCGILLRIIMRIIAIIFPELASGVTFGGVLSLLGSGISFCLGISILYTLVEAFFPKHWLKKGVLFGMMILAIYGTPILHNPDSTLNGFQAMLTILLFSCVFLTGGLLMAFTFSKVNSWVQSQRHERVLYISCFVLIIPALIKLVQMTIDVFREWI